MKVVTTLVALLVAGATAFGSVVVDRFPEKPAKKVFIAQPDQEKFQLIYADTSRGDVKVSILNEEGKKLYSEYIANEDGFARQFDFALLPDGEYVFEVTGPEGVKISETVIHKKHKKSEPSAALIADVLNIDGKKKYSLTVLNSSNDPVQIKIYDSKGRLLHKETVSDYSRFRKTYNLKNASTSTFRFEVSNSAGELTMFTK